MEESGNIQIWAFIVGLIMGSGAITAVCYVWIRKQTFGFGGGALSFFGVLLVGLSVWTSARIEVTSAGLKAEFERLERELDQVAEANVAVSGEVEKITEIAETSKTQFIALTQALEERKTLSSTQLSKIRTPLLAVPTVNRERLDSKTLSLDRRLLKESQKEAQ